MIPLPAAALAALAVVPLAAGAAAPALARPAALRLPPAAATVLLTLLALSLALVTGLLLCLAAVVALAGLPGLSGLGHWSPGAVRATVPVSLPVALVIGAAGVFLLARACVHLTRVVAHARLAATAAAGTPAPSQLVVVDDARPFAYAVPGRHRRIVASTAMLARLTPAQRRVLLAHEEAHLRYRHHLYVQLGRLAAAAGPHLRPVSAAIDLAVERWADEVAAREAGGRTAAACALLAAASTQPPAGPASAAALPAAQSYMATRIACLLQRPARYRVLAAAILAAAAVSWAAGCVVIGHVHALMELAESH